MKTSTSGIRPKKTSGNKEAVNNSKQTIKRLSPDEEEIRARAWNIYLERIDNGEDGTPEKDWVEAEAFFSSND